MKNLRLIAMGTGALLVAGSVVLVACSSEDTVVNPVDSGTDSPTEASKPDSGGPTDSGTDSAPPFDGGQVDFTKQLAEALCTSAARCCFGDGTLAEDAGVDGGHYDQTKCKSIYSDTGFEGSLHGFDKVDAGALALDSVAAGECLAQAKTIACNVNGTDLAALRTKCFNAFYSTAGAGSTCTVSAGCGKGLFCNKPDDGGPGTCQALRGDGGACGDWTHDLTLIDESCSWRGMGGDQFCQYFTPATIAAWPNADNQLDAGEWHCEPASNTGGPCMNDGWCKGGICETNTSYACQSPAVLFPPVGLCTSIVKP